MWKEYLNYLSSWVDAHQDPRYTSCVPESLTEWLACEGRGITKEVSEKASAKGGKTENGSENG